MWGFSYESGSPSLGDQGGVCCHCIQVTSVLGNLHCVGRWEVIPWGEPVLEYAEQLPGAVWPLVALCEVWRLLKCFCCWCCYRDGVRIHGEAEGCCCCPSYLPLCCDVGLHPDSSPATAYAGALGSGLSSWSGRNVRVPVLAPTLPPSHIQFTLRPSLPLTEV